MMIAHTNEDVAFMQEALLAAEKAARSDEVPVGAVLVRENRIIAIAHNEPISQHDPSAHAEVMVLRKSANILNNYRLPGCTLYVTLEPCCMCVGAIVQARISRLVYGAYDHKAGCVSSQLQLLDQPFFNHRVEHIGGLLEEASLMQLRHFFKARRKNTHTN